jgi:chromosome segregation ATPase
MPSEPLTDAQLNFLGHHAEYGHFEGQDYDAVETLVAEVRRLQDEVAGANENVASWQGAAADLGGERDDLEDGYYVLLSQCHRLEEERNQLRVERTAMLDALEAVHEYLDAPRRSPNGSGLGRAKMRVRLDRARDLIGDNRE